MIKRYLPQLRNPAVSFAMTLVAALFLGFAIGHWFLQLPV